MANLDIRLRNVLNERQIALWLSNDCDDSTIDAAIPLPWSVIWSQIKPQLVSSIVRRQHSSTYHLIDAKSDVPPPGTSSDITFIYDISVPDAADSASSLRKRRRSQELENEVEGWSGLLVYAGPFETSNEWLRLIEALSPASAILLERPKNKHVKIPLPSNPIHWVDDIVTFFEQAASYLNDLSKDNVLDLKDAPGVEVDRTPIEAMGDGWQLLTRRYVRSPLDVDQEDFDAFLSGDPTWAAISAGAACDRGSICQVQSDEPGSPQTGLDPISHVLGKIKSLDESETDPLDPLEQVLIFSEAGSGCTTLLRQIGLAIAREGYPTIITTPHPRRLSIESVTNAIIHIQEKWAASRQGPGSGSGTLPVCLVLDVDAELPARFSKLMRGALGDLHRKLLLVRALRRSEEEIKKSHGVLRLLARTSEGEILALGKHFRTFCARYGLEPIPSDDEWRAFYQGFGQIRHRESKKTPFSEVDTPPLFLIGLYPFVKERVRDERSLERYLYKRWNEIADHGGRKLIDILASAGSHGIAVPFESLARDPELDNALYGRLGSEDERLVDFFSRWLRIGWDRRNWGLYVRHAALGTLLTRILRADEADAPYSILLPILRDLVGTEADRWFAEQLAYVLGRRFRRHSGAFSLEVDTALQRAARAIFDAVPQTLRDSSRTICHHHARYFIHTLHACLSAIEKPESTHLPEHAVQDLATRALEKATALIDTARTIPDDRERVSNVLNTLAASIAHLASVYAERGENDSARSHYRTAMQTASEAVLHDCANGHALYNLINTGLRRFESQLVSSDQEAEEILQLIEDRLETLMSLWDSRQWRNTNDDDAEYAVAGLVFRLNNVVRELRKDPNFRTFAITSSVARVLLAMRDILGTDALRDAFRDRQKAVKLRELRQELADIENKGPRTLVLHYKLYLNDPLDRYDYAARLDLLALIQRKAPEEYDPYLHDHAALLCLTGSFEAGAALFRRIYSLREGDSEKWFWINERLLVQPDQGQPLPKQVVVRVTDHRAGWARIEGTSIRVKIQPRQFGNIQTGQYISAYIRFRLSGLQAVDTRMARFDLEAMGCDPRLVGRQ